MKKWILLTVVTISMLLGAVAFWGTPQIVKASTGVNVANHTQDEIIRYLTQKSAVKTDPVTYAVRPSTTLPYAAGQLSLDAQNNALAMVNQVRYIAGLPEVLLDTEHQNEIQAAALVNAVNYGLDHSPKQPNGMNDELYALGYAGAGNSVLAMGQDTINTAIVDGWMDDSDVNFNLASLGHRRRLLNPRMQKTCFGAVGIFYAMYDKDRSGSSTVNGIVWPAQQMPLEYFHSSYAWSYSFDSDVALPDIHVNLKKRGTNKEWNFDGTSADGYFNVNNIAFDLQSCIIFKPDDISYEAGDIFDVCIQSGSVIVASYSVEFFSIGRTGKADPIVLKNGVAEKATLLPGAELEYEFTAPSAGKYTFFSEGDADTYGYLFDNILMEHKNQIAYNNNGGDAENFKMTVELARGQKVFLKVHKYYYNTAEDVKVWACKNYTISFDANGGSISGTPFSMTKLHGIDITLPKTMSCEKHYKVIYDANGGSLSPLSNQLTASQSGWNTAADGTGTSFDAGGSFHLNSDVTLYAQHDTATFGELPNPSRPGYTFDAWYTEPVNGTKVTNNTAVTENTTIYAHWTMSNGAAELTTVQPINGIIKSGKKYYYFFTAPVGGTYCFETTGTTNTYGTLYRDSAYTDILETNNNGGDGKNFSITVRLEAAATVFLEVKGYSGATGAYAVSAKKTYLLKEIALGNYSDSLNSFEENYYKFVVPADGTYSFGTEGTLDTVGALYSDKNFDSMIGTNDDSYFGAGGNFNFRIDRDLKAGEAVYLKVWGYGNTNGAFTLYVRQIFAITQQPVDVVAASGKTVTMKVKGIGDGLTYQWQYSKDNGATWVNSIATGAKTATISLTAKESFNGRLYRCLVSCDSTSIASSAAKLTVTSKPKITTQPSNKSVNEGDTVKFSIAAQGEGLTYQWQYSKDGGKTWTNNTVSSAKKATLSLTAKETWNGRLYHCIVTNEAGSVTSEAASLTVKATMPVISIQPVSVVTTAGTTATFSVTASGSNLTYQWQYSKDGINWTNSTASGAKTATMETNVKASFNGRKYHCIVTNENGSVITESAGLTVH